jgi:hypothetical protein
MRVIGSEARQNFLMLCDPELARVVRRGRTSFAELSNNDQTRVNAWLSAVSLTAQTTFAVRSSPRPSALEWGIASFTLEPGLRPWWESARGLFNAKFVAHIEGLAAQGGMASIDEVLPWWKLEESELIETPR